MQRQQSTTFLLPDTVDTFVESIGGSTESGDTPESVVDNATPPDFDVIDEHTLPMDDDSSSSFLSPMSCADDIPQFFRQSELRRETGEAELKEGESDAPQSNSDDASAIEPAVTEEEKILIAPVQSLLDIMNSASSRLNDCEVEIHKLEDARRTIASDWKSKKSQLLSEIGASAIERARPVFDAYQEQQALQLAVNEAAEQYSQCTIECNEMRNVLQTAHENGSSDEHLSRVLSLLVAEQTRRDACERLSMDRMNEFKLAQEKCAELKKEIGARALERVWPWYEAFAHSKVESEACAASIHSLRKEMTELRDKYKSSMTQLEEISAKVHALRNPI